MGWSIANLWDTPRSKDIAREIVERHSGTLYCGPACVVWIAAVWNEHKGRTYDYIDRANSISGGPRTFTTKFGKKGLSELLKQETNGDLKLGRNTFYKYGTIHRLLERYDKPFIIRMMGPSFIDQIHYVSLYKSRKWIIDWGFDKIKFYWQDNGTYGKKNGGNPGLYGTGKRKVGESVFTFGTKRVVYA